GPAAAHAGPRGRRLRRGLLGRPGQPGRGRLPVRGRPGSAGLPGHGRLPGGVRPEPDRVVPGQLMNQEAALLAAVCQNPDDTDVRRVYADWLEDAGRVERAELIRVQCDVASITGDDPRRPALEMREEALLVAHEAEWRPEVQVWARKKAHFRRG